MKECNKLKIYRLLGAEQFQKIVFKIEELKYKVIEKILPNINEWYEKQCDKKYKKILKRKNQIENKELIKYFQQQKLLFRKEVIYKQNRNYHYDLNHPTNFLLYLKYNKKVHVKGLVGNVIIISSLLVLTLVLGEVVLPIVLVGIYEIISLIINFECINLQNYNLCRFENVRMKQALEKKEKYILEQNMKKYKNCIEPVSKTICSQIELPTVDEIINNITTKEQAVQLLEYAKQQLSYIETNNMQKRRK